MAETTVTRWGIMGPGNIAKTFTQNLLQHAPAELTRSPSLVHRITGVASSSSLTTAQNFIADNITPHQDESISCTAYSSYTSLATSDDVDVVYIATPHSAHFSTAMLCLKHNKAVLIEKPIAVNTAQAEILIQTAKEKNLFLMEGMWTRFFPITLYVRDVIRSGQIGEVIRVNADFSLGLSDMEGIAAVFGNDGGRILDPNRAGGVLLDLGVYALTWIFLSVYNEHSANLIGAIMTPYPPPTITSSSPSPSWVDTSTTLLLTLPSFPNGATTCHAVASTSLYTTADPGYGGDDQSTTNANAHRFSVPSARIQGTHGEIQVFGPLPRPQRVRVFSKTPRRQICIGVGVGGAGTDGTGAGTETGEAVKVVVPGNVVEVPGNASTGYRVEEKFFASPGDGYGMFWEADEVARCLRHGSLQSTGRDGGGGSGQGGMSWNETLAVMRVLDQARERCGSKYEEKVEGLDF